MKYKGKVKKISKIMLSFTTDIKHKLCLKAIILMTVMTGCVNTNAIRITVWAGGGASWVKIRRFQMSFP